MICCCRPVVLSMQGTSFVAAVTPWACCRVGLPAGVLLQVPSGFDYAAGEVYLPPAPCCLE